MKKYHSRKKNYFYIDKTNMKKFNLIDYKGKWFTIQDKNILWKFDKPYICKETTKNIVTEKGFVTEHKIMCDQYGISPYIVKDKELKKLYDPR